MAQNEQETETPLKSCSCPKASLPLTEDSSNYACVISDTTSVVSGYSSLHQDDECSGIFGATRTKSGERGNYFHFL
jgi:hypothetical protein